MSIIDGQLELALHLPKEMLLKNEELLVGFDNKDKTWELIIKYSGDVQKIKERIDAVVEVLSFGYAIVIIKEEMIGVLEEIEQIEYIEKPRRLYFQASNGRAISCIDSVQNINSSNLTGEGVIIAIIDSGIDYAHDDFRNDDGTTRIITLWDQTVKGRPPKGYLIGTEYSREEINLALSKESRDEQLAIVNSVDISGHGTHVAGIACGNGRMSNGRFRGVAYKSEIIVVKIGESIEGAYPSTTRLMEALEYVNNIAIRIGKPIVINLSFGNNYGSHTGRNILEQYIDNIANVWKNNICIGTGNEGLRGGHYSGKISKFERIELVVGEEQNYVSIQLWKCYCDDFDIELISPQGTRITIERNIDIVSSYTVDNDMMYIYYGQPSPLQKLQEVNIIIYPMIEPYILDGIWIIEIVPKLIRFGEFNIWLGSDKGINDSTRFLQSTNTRTLTIPSTAYNAISVGAYNGMTNVYALFSGTGTREYNILYKPNIVAPGVDIISTKVGGGYEARTGTSMATPFVSGSVALLMEWGIVKKNDRYLYGQKVVAYLEKGARMMDEFKEYPNLYVGWGALCLKDAFP